MNRRGADSSINQHSAATSSRRFTVEGNPSDVFAFAERFGLKVTRPRWWQRTYAVPRWIVWLVVAWWILGLPRAIETLVGWFRV